MRTCPMVFLSLMVFAGSVLRAQASTTLYVDQQAPLGGDGLTWATAYRHLQDGLAAADAMPAPVEVRVAQGVYRPDDDEAGNVFPGDPTASFDLPDEIALRGGYAGNGAPDPDARDVSNSPTVLDGDLAENDGPAFFNYDDNSRRVVIIDSNSVLVEGVTIRGGNAAAPENVGGGMLVLGGADVTISLCTFDANSAATNGGAVHVSTNSTVYQYDTLYTGNRSIGSGGAVYVEGPATYHACGCSYSMNDATIQGGAVFAGSEGTATFADCTFTENTATTGAAVAMFEVTAASESCSYTFNVAQSTGGAVDVSQSAATFDACTFEENMAGLSGGAVRGEACVNLSLAGCTFNANTATANDGGAVLLESFGPGHSAAIDGSSFTQNTAVFGGGISLRATSATIRLCSFVDNHATSSGGAIASLDNDSSTFERNMVYSNTSDVTGGGIRSDGNATFDGCRIIGNSAPFNGGGADVAAGLTTFRSVEFNGNVSTPGGLHVFAAEARLVNCTFAQNVGTGGTAGAMEVREQGTITADNIIAWGNGPVPLVRETFEKKKKGQKNPLNSTLLVNGSDLEFGWPGSNFTADPLFADPDGPDDVPGTPDDVFGLLAGSPCIDVGLLVADLPAIDPDGKPRVVGCIPDVGAYETGIELDCNDNGAADACDIADGTSLDTNSNGIPDECELFWTYTGLPGGSWHEASNWFGGTVPDLTSDVFIGEEVVVTAPAVANSLRISLGNTQIFGIKNLIHFVEIDVLGRLTADGSISGDVVNRGIIDIGHPVSIFEVGSFNQTETGRLDIDIAGFLPGEEYDVLMSNGPASVDGYLHIRHSPLEFEGFEFNVISGAPIVHWSPGISNSGIQAPQGYFNHAESDGLIIAETWEHRADLDVPIQFGTFGDPPVESIRPMEFDDLNGDGLIDAAALIPLFDLVQIYLNNGTTGQTWDEFVEGPITVPTGANPSSVAIADVDQMNGNDLLVTNTGDNTMSVHLNDGSGNFAPGLPEPTPPGPLGVQVLDINGDADPDIIVTSGDGNTAQPFVGGPGPGMIPLPPLVYDDLDRVLRIPQPDRRDDIAAAGSTDKPGQSFIQVTRNNGDETFTYDPPIILDVIVKDLLAADLDRDGTEDLIVIGVDPMGQSLAVVLQEDPASCEYRAGPGIPIGGLAQAGAVTNLDNPDVPDLDIVLIIDSASESGTSSLQAIRNNGSTPGLLNLTTDIDLAVSGTMQYVGTADFNGDGAEDIALLGPDGFEVLLNESGPADPCPADSDGDGIVDITDLLTCLSAWGPCPAQSPCPCDTDFDDDVDVADLLAVLASWGECDE